MQPNYIGNNDFRGHLAYLAQNGDNQASNALNYVGGDYTGSGDVGLNLGELGQYAAGQSPEEDAANTAAIKQYLMGTYSNWANGAGSPRVQGVATSGGFTPTENTQFLNDQEASLNSTLGRNRTALNQGITQNEDEYNRQVGASQGDKERAYQTYQSQREGQIKGREDTRNTNSRNAGAGYRSLAQMIGRASGTGSSAYRDLLPNVIGSDLSGKQKIANETYGTNLQGIDKKQLEYDLNFQNALSDLLRQKKENESGIRTRFETQNQTILDRLRGVQGDRAKVAGGGYAAVKAAQAGTDASIEQSKNNVENFFNEFRTPYTRQQATVGTPDLANYTTDRTQINARNSGQNPDNPYAALLRRKLQGGV